MTDIVERLLDYSKDDHERGCQGRFYDCSCGYDDKRDPLMVEAAKTIASLRDENASLASWQCEFTDGKTGLVYGQGGTTFCIMAKRMEQNLGQVEKLSEELERVKREAERAHDAHGVRFLNYLEETARLADEVTRLKAELHIAQEWSAKILEGQKEDADEIDRLRAALEAAADRLFDAGLNDAWADARAALGEKP